MKLSVHLLARDEYTLCEKEVYEGHPYGIWRIVEHTGAGWFPWPEAYDTKESAEKAMKNALKRACKDFD